MPRLTLTQAVDDHRTVRLYFDISANYPSQLMSPYPLPLKEHEDRLVASFADDVAAASDFILSRDLTLPLCERIEISGFWPVALHARLRKYPPNFEPIEVSAADLSTWQQQAMGIAETEPAFTVSAGHLRPVQKRVVFLRTARFWLQLGFQLTAAGDVYSTPASHWGRPFAKMMEARRRACEQSRHECLEAGEPILPLRPGGRYPKKPSSFPTQSLARSTRTQAPSQVCARCPARYSAQQTPSHLIGAAMSRCLRVSTMGGRPDRLWGTRGTTSRANRIAWCLR